ncbi:hypothetical protein E3E14_01265 [Streptomyces sp. ICN441]|uniref:Peptidase inhibitor family I36 protein n=1 Tax=Streptomyces tirandamycinicus TaxID=2174846 RepID=A0A2S1SXH3_9ACTN|nr:MULTISPECIES: hypothetical protein [Streptomyces]AWI31095.1 hypothetical protein DDW44_21660 [Streptomyces tirandamycinicus]TFE58502.1 hypothetical protein E3E14_01265 [Streptomyces sp. ICN441]
MLRRSALRTAALSPTALAATLSAALSLAALPAPAGAAPVAPAAPGQVCFWTGAGQHGTGWCYSPPGYRDVPAFLHDNAASFRSDVNRAVYAIDWARGTCYARLIRAYDHSDNWSWGSRIDGVADTDQGCEAG